MTFTVERSQRGFTKLTKVDVVYDLCPILQIITHGTWSIIGPKPRLQMNSFLASRSDKHIVSPDLERLKLARVWVL